MSHKSFTILLAVSAITFATPSQAHDPLRGGHHGEDFVPADSSGAIDAPDLDAVRALVEAFRKTGDDKNLDRAWTLIEPAIGPAVGDPETLTTAAFVAQSRHRFDEATELLERALAINGNHDEAWLLLASVRLVRGETRAAANACGQLRNVALLVMLTCDARVALAEGDSRIALTRLTALLRLADERQMPRDLLAWSYSVAGDLAAAAGEMEQAIELYRHSLERAERTQVRAALVDVLLAEARYDDALRCLPTNELALPLLVRRMIAAKQLDRLHEMQAELSMVEHEFAHWVAAEDWLHAREMARFYIDVIERPALARRLALINVALQREPEDLRLETRTRLKVDARTAGERTERR